MHLPEPGETSPYAGPSAVAAWNLMGGMDGNLLPIVVEMFGITDVELLMRELAVIREFTNRPQS